MKRLFKVLAVVVAVAILLFAAIYFVLNGQKNADHYTLGKDQIAAIKTVVGVRDLTGVSTSSQNGVLTKTYEYKSATATSDISQYTVYLIGENFVLTDKTDDYSQLCFAKESVESGMILIIQISTTDFGYTINIQKGAGTLSRY